MKKTTISILLLTLSALCSIIPLLMRPEFVFGTDHFLYINWAYQVGIGIREGILYPRWLSLSNGGYGSPTMIFYSPLFYWITGVVNLFIPSLIVSLKITTFAGFLLSGLAMYLFLRSFCGHSASIAGGIAYQLLPYHLIRFYVHVTLAETFAYVWIPLIFYFLYKGCIEDTLPHWLGLAFSYAGLVLTHLVSAYIFTFVIVSFALFLAIRGKGPRLFLKFTLASIFGLAFSAAYFIPMVTERRFVHIKWIELIPAYNYIHNFLFLPENSLKEFYTALALIVILLAFLVIISLRIFYYRSRAYGIMPGSFPFFFSLVLSFSLFISTPLSWPIWRLTPGLSTIQFPWRWLMVSTFAASVLVALTFDAFSIADIKRDVYVRVSMALFCTIIAVNLYISSVYIVTAEYVKEGDMKWILTDGGDVIEYRPVWLSHKTKDFSRLSPPQGILPPPFVQPSQKTEEFLRGKEDPVIFRDGKGTVDVVSWRSQSRSFKVNASIPSILRVSTFYYPGWTALLNGKEISIDIEKDSGAMLLNVPSGKNEVLLEFRDTPLRRASKWISIISVIVAFIGIVIARAKRPINRVA